MKLSGTLVQGYRVASGLSTRDPRFPTGTIREQEPYFAALGFSFNDYFKGQHVWGTLNLDLHDKAFKQKRSDWYFKNVHWSTILPAENFYLTKCTVHYNGASYKAIWYHPDPETKPSHFHFPTLLEFVCEKIPDIGYGMTFEVEIPDDCIEILDYIPPAEGNDLKAWL